MRTLFTLAIVFSGLLMVAQTTQQRARNAFETNYEKAFNPGNPNAKADVSFSGNTIIVEITSKTYNNPAITPKQLADATIQEWRNEGILSGMKKEMNVSYFKVKFYSKSGNLINSHNANL